MSSLSYKDRSIACGAGFLWPSTIQRYHKGLFLLWRWPGNPCEPHGGRSAKSFQSLRVGWWVLLPLISCFLHSVVSSGANGVFSFTAECWLWYCSLASCLPFALHDEVSILSLRFPVEWKVQPPDFAAPKRLENRMRCANLPRDTSQNSLQERSFDRCCRQYATLALLFWTSRGHLRWERTGVLLDVDIDIYIYMYVVSKCTFKYPELVRTLLYIVVWRSLLHDFC